MATAGGGPVFDCSIILAEASMLMGSVLRQATQNQKEQHGDLDADPAASAAARGGPQQSMLPRNSSGQLSAGHQGEDDDFQPPLQVSREQYHHTSARRGIWMFSANMSARILLLIRLCCWLPAAPGEDAPAATETGSDEPGLQASGCSQRG